MKGGKVWDRKELQNTLGKNEVVKGRSVEDKKGEGIDSIG